MTDSLLNIPFSLTILTNGLSSDLPRVFIDLVSARGTLTEVIRLNVSSWTGVVPEKREAWEEVSNVVFVVMEGWEGLAWGLRSKITGAW